MNNLNNLSWNRPRTEQEKTMDFLIANDNWDIQHCIQNASKDIWENLVYVLSKKENMIKEQALQGLLFLFKDLSWPGASMAFDIIKQIPKDKVLIDLEIALSDAFEENDGIWAANLKQVISYFKFTKNDFKKINLSKVLQISEW